MGMTMFAIVLRQRYCVFLLAPSLRFLKLLFFLFFEKKRRSPRDTCAHGTKRRVELVEGPEKPLQIADISQEKPLGHDNPPQKTWSDHHTTPPLSGYQAKVASHLRFEHPINFLGSSTINEIVIDRERGRRALTRGSRVHRTDFGWSSTNESRPTPILPTAASSRSIDCIDNSRAYRCSQNFTRASLGCSGKTLYFESRELIQAPALIGDIDARGCICTQRKHLRRLETNRGMWHTGHVLVKLQVCGKTYQHLSTHLFT